MKKLVTFLAVVVSTLFAAGCKNPVDLGDFRLDFNERVEVAATFENGSGVATIGNLRLTWDGEALQDLAPLAPVDRIAVSVSKFGRHTGNHRLSFVIAGQTTSPNAYRVTGLTLTSYDEAGTVSGRLTLEPRTATLGTSDAISYDFRL